MTEGLHAVITLDESDFVAGVNKAAVATEKFQQATTQAAVGTGVFKGGLDGLGSSLKASGKSTGGFNDKLKQTSNTFRIAKGSASQFGFQLQDIAVQLQAGTNAGVVFAQQGSQIASLFGPGGALLGAVIAISGALAGPFIASLMDSSASIEDLVADLDDMEEGIADLTEAEKNYIRLSTANKISETKEQLNALSSSTLLNTKAALRLALAHEKIGAKGAKERVADLTLEVARQEAAVATLNGQLAILEDRQKIASGEKAGTDKEIEEAERKAKRLADIARREEERRQRMAERLAEQAKQARAREIAEEEMHQQRLISVRAGLFGGAGEDFELEAEQAKHEAKFEQLREALLNEFITIQEFNALEEEEERRHYNALADIRANGLKSLSDLIELHYGEQAAMIADSMRSVVKSLSTHSRAAFNINKVAALADAVISGHSAAVAAWDKGMHAGGPPVAAAFMAASLAKTGAQIASINATQFGSGSGGTSSSGGGAAAPVAAAPAAPQENQVVNIALEGEVFGGDQLRTLFTQLNDLQDEGFTFNFQG